MNYETIIGLEIHVELSTKTKMFCRCTVPSLTDKPNTRTCPICLGLPGALPYANKQAIESCIKIALALNCKINNKSFFERKNYFYPDLAKGFQTSQYLHPFGEKGELDIKVDGKKKTIGITRVHMEEDTGKLMHSKIDGKDVSLIDFNRSGVPLVEIVTEPDIRSAKEAKEFLTKLQRIIRYLNVSDADMEKGHMRLEPNISLREVKSQKLKVKSDELPKYKVEVKNINSFKFVEKAIKYEQKRHEELLEKGETPVQETRGWNEFKNKTVSQRSKEEAHDYRYFPEPDLPPITISNDQLEAIRNSLPELPEERIVRFVNEYGIKPYDAEILTRDKKIADFSEEAFEAGKKYRVKPQVISSWIINKNIRVDDTVPAALIRKLVEERTVETVDEKRLIGAVEKVIRENTKAVADYKSGKENAIMFLLGMAMKAYGGKVDTIIVKNAILEKLNK